MAVAAIMPSAVLRGVPIKLTSPIQYAPAFGDGMCDWQDTPVKARQQVIFKPPLQIGAPLARRERNNPRRSLPIDTTLR